ncbi:hypothetical protein AgCh_005321 [Apium graveolens]
MKQLCLNIDNFTSEFNKCIPHSITYRAAAIELDVAGDGEAIKLAVEKAWKCFGRIDALVNNADLRDQKGCIINISSIDALNKTQINGSLAYNSSKSGLNSMLRYNLLHLNKQDISGLTEIRTYGKSELNIRT